MSEETKEVKIAIPEGYEIDTKKSTFTNIVFKKVKSWIKDLEKGGYTLIGYSIDGFRTTLKSSNINYINIFPTEKHAKSAKAYALISHILRYDDRFGGEITDKEWEDQTVKKYAISRCNGHLDTENLSYVYSPIAFHTNEQRNLFLTENVQLLHDYFMID